MQLAVMDHNENVDRAQAVTLEGYYLVFVITLCSEVENQKFIHIHSQFFEVYGQTFSSNCNCSESRARLLERIQYMSSLKKSTGMVLIKY